MFKRAVLFLIILMLVFSVYVFAFATSPKTLDRYSVQGGTSGKPVVLLVVDSLVNQPLQKAIKEGKAPALEFLIQKGQLRKDVISSYPTMSVTIDSTLLTGTYPNENSVPGLVWYDKKENRLINYGSGKGEILRLGVTQVLEDGLLNLNQQHLSPSTKTIYEELAEKNKDSASVNGLIFRGVEEQRLRIPKIADISNLLPEKTTVSGPSILSLGALTFHNPANRLQINAWQGMGYNDEFSAKELKYLIQQNQLPAFTLTYFPDMDHSVHEKGPSDLEGIEKVDKQLQSILNEYETWDEAVKKVVWLVYGDSGQSSIKDEKQRALIELRKILNRYHIWEIGSSIKRQDQLVLAVNERMAYIYVKGDHVTEKEIVSQLKKDPRISLIAWKEAGKNFVTTPDSDKTLSFRPDGKYVDDYGQSWNLKGDLSILDLQLNRGKLEYGDYPDGLARLFGALHSHDGRFIIIDAKPGYEFFDSHTPTHLGGGGHGSLHKADSVTPLIIAGTTDVPEYDRAVDFKKWILSMTEGTNR